MGLYGCSYVFPFSRSVRGQVNPGQTNVPLLYGSDHMTSGENMRGKMHGVRSTELKRRTTKFTGVITAKYYYKRVPENYQSRGIQQQARQRESRDLALQCNGKDITEISFSTHEFLVNNQHLSIAR